MNDELKDEEKRIRRLKFIVDFALNFIRVNDISLEEALSIFEGVKRHALKLFPDKEEAFDLIYAPRFRRLLNEKFKRS